VLPSPPGKQQRLGLRIAQRGLRIDDVRKQPEQEIRLIENPDRRHPFCLGGGANAREVDVRRQILFACIAEPASGRRRRAWARPGAPVLREGGQRAAAWPAE
jgi:hypothetical protein